jgi:hypothetical protein
MYQKFNTIKIINQLKIKFKMTDPIFFMRLDLILICRKL